MSKRDLKKYLSELNNAQLQEQIIELYDKFIPVKTYYNFIFNPNENSLIREAKQKVSNEYFPVRGQRPKMRRSVAQKFIKHFISLGVDPFLIADLMLYNIELAQTLSAEKKINSELFYKSMLLSFNQCIGFLIKKGILSDFESRIVTIKNNAQEQNWINFYEFNAAVERFNY
jgi:Family of unknown function (DUF6155)